jgi:hypothetical protein
MAGTVARIVNDVMKRGRDWRGLCAGTRNDAQAPLQVHKRYSDFIALDARLRAKYGNRKLDALLAKSRLPG